MRSPRGPSTTRPQMPSSSSACSIAAAATSLVPSGSPRPIPRAQLSAAASVARIRSGTTFVPTSVYALPVSSSMDAASPLSRLRLRLLQLRGAELHLVDPAGADGGGHEVPEQRVRPLRPAAELRVELAGDEPRVVGELDDLDEPAVGREAAEEHPGLMQHLAVLVVELEPVAVPLVHDLLAVCLLGERPRRQLAGVETPPHGAAEIGHVPLLGHQVDHRRR